jgi:SpoVK/Ycf46/Vps4 family AAA+-type ATPase
LIQLPLFEPLRFQTLGITPLKGILLYGPPGTGKTMIAKAVAHETGAHVVVINGAEITSKYMGETEANLTKLFNEAQANAPSIVFIDEIDALCPKRDDAQNELDKRVVATLLNLMDGADAISKVVVLAATNRPNTLDEALRRPGRFDREIEIGIPSASGRLDILQKILSKISHELEEADIEKIAFDSHGYVGADLAAVCREAGLKAMKRQLSLNTTELPTLHVNITFKDMQDSMTMVKPSAMREVSELLIHL